MEKLATASIYFDTRRKKENDTYPVKLRVYFDKEVRFYSTGIDLTEKEYLQSYLSQKPKKELKDSKIAIVAIENKANAIIKDLDPFSYDRFEGKMFRHSRNAKDVFFHYHEYVRKLEAEGRVKTASSYDLSLKSIQLFISENKKASNELLFSAVTPDFLNQYENWMIKTGRQKTTVGIYLRSLRSIFNMAISEREISQEIYPFGKRKYQIPGGRNVKKALTKNDLRSLFTLQIPADGHLEKARDFWFFSYQCNGINIRDIAELKYKNVQTDTIIFVRNKTKNTAKTNIKPIVAARTTFLNSIIKKYGNEPTDSNTYVFPILNDGMSEKDKMKAVENFVRFINQHIKTIAKEANINPAISTYWARHSFTTSAIRNGASMEYIQESLGHQNLNTTMSYWGGFEDNVKKEIADKLMDFE